MELAAVRGELVASVPAQLSDKIEVRRLGIDDLGDSQLLPRARVALVADLGPSAGAARLPHCSSCRLDGLRVHGASDNLNGVETLEHGRPTDACTKR